MALWLFKSEPSEYSLSDLMRDRRTTWDGISNALARIHLRAVKAGDRILFYHTGKEKAIVGEMVAATDAHRSQISGDPKDVVVEVTAPKAFAMPVPLASIRKRPEFRDFDLVRNSRLSVMPVSERHWRLIEQLSAAGTRSRNRR
jgi:predicted RNA-binding protein with PUA-like domain